MATTATTTLLPLLLLLLLSATTTFARPCKTLFFYSTTTTTTTSFYPTTTTTQNPFNTSPRFLTLFFTTATGSAATDNSDGGSSRFITFNFVPTTLRTPRPFLFIDQVNEKFEDEKLDRQEENFRYPLEFYSSVKTSIRERTKDIMSVVAALLFGVGCGALTAATMYLIWSLVSPHRFDFDDSDDDEDEDEEKEFVKQDLTCLTKMGYVAISEDDLKKPLQPKETA